MAGHQRAPAARGTRRCLRGPPAEARRSAISLGGARRLRRPGRRRADPRRAPWRRARPPGRRAAAAASMRSTAASSAASSGCTSWTRPIAQRVRGVEQLPGEEQRARLGAADARQANGEIVAGISPSRTSVKPKRASSRASTMSQQQASPVPPPSAAPCTRAITGTGQLSTAANMAAARSASATLRSCVSSPPARIHSRSAPAQNDAARARRSRPRAGRRRAASAAKASCTAAIRSASKALRRSGPVEPDARDAAVALEREPAHIRKTPKRGSGMGARAAAARPSASTRRVSRGSITPSSHRRAVE